MATFIPTVDGDFINPETILFAECTGDDVYQLTLNNGVTVEVHDDVWLAFIQGADTSDLFDLELERLDSVCGECRAKDGEPA